METGPWVCRGLFVFGGRGMVEFPGRLIVTLQSECGQSECRRKPAGLRLHSGNETCPYVMFRQSGDGNDTGGGVYLLAFRPK